MNRLVPLVLLAPLLIGCVSVTPAPLQVPVAPIAPMLEAKGDLEASLGFSADASPEARVAYSPLSNVVAFASGSHSTERSDEPGSFDRSYGEAGMGFYTSSGDFTFEALAGLSRGVQHGAGNWVVPSSGPRCTEDPICFLILGPLAYLDTGTKPVPYSYRTVTSGVFGQANAGWTGGRHRLAFTLRLTRADFGTITTSPTDLPAPSHAITLDPGLSWRIPLSSVFHVEMQGGTSYTLGGGDWNVLYDDRWALFSRADGYFAVRLGIRPFGR